MIITRSPLRISLGGGGTDLPSYYREHTGFLIAAAIDKYVYITLHQTFVPELIIKYSKLERVGTVDEIEHPIIREAMRLVGRGQPPRWKSPPWPTSPPGRGSVVGQFHHGAAPGAARAQEKPRPPRRTRRAGLPHRDSKNSGEPIGKQDQYIAAYGGITCFRFLPDGKRRRRGRSRSARKRSSTWRTTSSSSSRATRARRPRSSRSRTTRARRADKGMVDNLHFVKDLGFQSQARAGKRATWTSSPG